MEPACAFRKSKELVRAGRGTTIFFCRFSQLTVLRLLTTEAIMGNDTKTISEAWALWDRVWADSRIEFLPEPDGFERVFRSRSRM